MIGNYKNWAWNASMPNFIYGEYKNTFKNAEFKDFSAKNFQGFRKNWAIGFQKIIMPSFVLLHFQREYIYVYNSIISSYEES